MSRDGVVSLLKRGPEGLYFDWDEMRRVAYEIGLKPREFWRLTFREYILCIEGYRNRETNDMRKRAWEVAHIMSASGFCKKPPSPDQLLGRKSEQPFFENEADWREYMRAKVAATEP